MNSWFYSKIENHIAEFRTLEGFGHLQKKLECNQLSSPMDNRRKDKTGNWSKHTVHEVKGRNITWEVVHSILLSPLGHTTQNMIRKTTLYYVWLYYFTFICQPNPEQRESEAMWGKELVPPFQPNLQTILSLSLTSLEQLSEREIKWLYMTPLTWSMLMLINYQS